MNTGRKFIESLEKKAKIFSPGVWQLYNDNTELCSWLLDPLADWSEVAFGEDIFDVAAKGYVEYCMNVAKEQKRYEKTGVFTEKSLENVKADIYEDGNYMDPYMWAAILIYGFWPSMINHLRMYRDEFIFNLSTDAKVLELASGHGVMGLLAAHHRKDLSLMGYDISPPAVSIARKLKNASKLENRTEFEIKDALDLEKAGKPGQYNGVIAAMLAEHLSDPNPLFKIIAHHLAPNGIAYFSTALESAQPDHIYEFNNESEPLKLAEESGLRVKSLICDTSSSGNGQKYLPRAIAMILTHR